MAHSRHGSQDEPDKPESTHNPPRLIISDVKAKVLPVASESSGGVAWLLLCPHTLLSSLCSPAHTALAFSCSVNMPGKLPLRAQAPATLLTQDSVPRCSPGSLLYSLQDFYSNVNFSERLQRERERKHPAMGCGHAAIISPFLSHQDFEHACTRAQCFSSL